MPIRPPRRRLSLAIAAAALLAARFAAAAPPTILPFKDVRTGMKGIGKTAFQGESVVSFDVEIVGTLSNIGPGQNLILARCSGGPLANTGILAGMSGSPVFVDGKLVGAVAYSWGFTKEPIAGITPIEEMLAVGRRAEAAPRRARPAAAIPWETALRVLSRPQGLGSFFADRLDRLAARPASASSSLPLSVSGVGTVGLARITPDLLRAGFLPMQSGGAGGPARAPARPLEPGSPVGVKLVRGDVDMTATGTVTWVDGDQLYAFGHPLYGLGDVDLPLTAARVETLLPSLEQSAKIASPLEEVGAFRQDRASAIFGRLGVSPVMIPVRLQMKDGSGERKTFAFDLADDPLLAPLLLYASLNGVLGTVERTFGSATVRLREGSVIKLDGIDDVRLDNLFAGDGAATDASGLSAFLLYLVMNNDWSAPKVKGINLLLDYEREPRTAAIRRVTLDRYRVKAGETVTAHVILSPFRGPDEVLTREIAIPVETPAGLLSVQIGNAAAMNRADDVDGPIMPRSLDQLVVLINRLRRNDRLYILASRSESGAYVGGARLPNLPPSVTALLTRPRTFGNYTYVPERGILEDDIAADAAVDGFARVALEVEPR
jgi:hypothetical protein